MPVLLRQIAAFFASLRWLRSGGIATAIASALIALGLTVAMREAALGEAAQEAESYSTLLADHLQGTLRRTDANLLDLQRNLVPTDLMHRARRSYWDGELDARLAGFPELHGLRVFGSGGELLFTSDASRAPRFSIADREHFLAIQKDPTAELYYSALMPSRASDANVFLVYRALLGPEGRFLGLVGASIDFQHYIDLFRKARQGREDSISIFRVDTMRPIARYPAVDLLEARPLPPDSATATAMASGLARVSTRTTSSLDGIARIYSTIRLEGAPLFVSVGITESSALHAWTRQVLPIGVASVILSVLLLVLVLQLSRSERALAELALHDPLTGLLNRRAAAELVERQLASAVRHGQPVAFAMLDIDHFKQVNDRFGHACGDQVLEGIAKLLAATTRAGDIACRHGGEEFLLVLARSGAADAAQLADRLRQRIEALAFSLPDGRRIQVTASLGIAAFPEHGQTMEELTAAADRALYEAKDAGRNRVRCAL